MASGVPSTRLRFSRVSETELLPLQLPDLREGIHDISEGQVCRLGAMKRSPNPQDQLTTCIGSQGDILTEGGLIASFREPLKNPSLNLSETGREKRGFHFTSFSIA